MRVVRQALAALALSLFALVAIACGTDAMATDSCRKIEQARCRKAPSCPTLGVQGGVGVEECVQFARDRCLHGLVVPDPGAAAVDRCVSSIEQASTCDPVVSPESTPACSFLSPIPTPDAGADVAGDAAADAPAE